MKPGARLITLTLPVTHGAFELLEKRNFKMSWGAATAFIHRRK